MGMAGCRLIVLSIQCKLVFIECGLSVVSQKGVHPLPWLEAFDA